MGMFDYIHCEYPLPKENKSFQKKDFYLPFQTKSLDSALDNYYIDEQGQLWLECFDIEDHSNPNAEKPIERLSGMFTKVNFRKVKHDFTGSITFYTSKRPNKIKEENSQKTQIIVSPFQFITFKARFIAGQLSSIDFDGDA